MITQVLYLLLFNLIKSDVSLSPSVTGGIDERPQITPETFIQNISLNMEKQKLLHILEDDKISINTKLALVDKYFDNSNSIVSTTNNMFGGGLLKDTDFFNL